MTMIQIVVATMENQNGYGIMAMIAAIAITIVTVVLIFAIVTVSDYKWKQQHQLIKDAIIYNIKWVLTSKINNLWMT